MKRNIKIDTTSVTDIVLSLMNSSRFAAQSGDFKASRALEAQAVTLSNRYNMFVYRKYQDRRGVFGYFNLRKIAQEVICPYEC